MHRRPAILPLIALALPLLVMPGVARAASAYMVPFDFLQPGEFTVQVPWRLGPGAPSCPLLVHGFFGYTWIHQEQIDLMVTGIDVEVNGVPYRPAGGPVTYPIQGQDSVVRPAGSSRVFWYRIFDLPLDLFPPEQVSRIRVKIHRNGRSRDSKIHVPDVYRSSPDMRLDGPSPYAGEKPGWFLFEVRRSSRELPGLPGYLSGDTHVHTEYTHSSFEYGGPIEMYARAARCVGLGWATFTDHGHSFDSRENLELYARSATYPPFGPRAVPSPLAKWQEFVARTRALAARESPHFIPLVGLEADIIMPSNQGEAYFCHGLVYGHDTLIPAEGPNGVDVKVAGVTLRHGEVGFSGRRDIFGADTLDLATILAGLGSGRFGRAYPGVAPVLYLAHPINGVDRFKKNQAHIGFWWRWGFDDEPDELPAFYEEAPGRERVSGFQIFNGNSLPYSEEVDPSVIYWDTILRDGLRMRPPRRNAIMGGTDTHGDLASAGVRSSAPSIHYASLYRKPDGEGFGSVRTLAAVPGAPSPQGILEALRNGRTVVTNGPALLIGHDRDGDGALQPGKDVLPSTAPGEELEVHDHDAETSRITVFWSSLAELGAVEEIQILGGRPVETRVIASITPSGDQAYSGSAVVTLDIASLPEWSYVRAQCVTRRGQDVFARNRLLKRAERRAYTNPIWVHRLGEASGTGPR